MKKNVSFNIILETKGYTIDEIATFYTINKDQIISTLDEKKDFFKILCSSTKRELNIFNNPYDKDSKRQRANTMSENAEVSNALEFNYSSK